MIVSTLSFAMHMLVSSFRILKPVADVLEVVLPVYRNMSTKAVKSKINFNSKHLGKGDPLPPYNGKLRVYNMRYCPYAQRTILALNAKGIDYEVVNINLVDKPEWLPSKSPLGKVPAIEIKENLCIYESLITVEYLDDVYPERPLMPKDPVMKAFDKITIEVTSPISSMFIRVIKFPDSIDQAVIDRYQNALTFVEDQLKSRGTKFLDGSEPGYGDYMIWPWIERIWIMQDYNKNLQFDTEKHKRLVEYIEDMLKDPAISQYLVPKDILIKFSEGYKEGNTPYYDWMVEN
ncbi:pyrimidodiazepine synthase [Phthorimaea operculella]|nr:pyrimidodiazepine synthase [Phthorimaea operculella]